jgi:cytidylate kinase
MSLHYYPLINKFMTRLKIDEAILKPLLGIDPASFIVPFITVAREPGSGGAPIAKAVAAQMGFEYIDEQIIDEISKSTKKRKAIIEAVDEKSRTKIEDIVHSMLNPEYIDDVKYVTELTKVILTYAIKGRVVILGRGANFITPVAKGLHVNITAPYEVRVQRAMDFEGFKRVQAEKVISDTEKERKNFVKQYLKKDPSKMNSYDITLNTQFFRVNEARDVIIEAFYRKFSRSARYLNLFNK